MNIIMYTHRQTDTYLYSQQQQQQQCNQLNTINDVMCDVMYEVQLTSRKVKSNCYDKWQTNSAHPGKINYVQLMWYSAVSVKSLMWGYFVTQGPTFCVTIDYYAVVNRTFCNQWFYLFCINCMCSLLLSDKNFGILIVYCMW